VEEEYPQRFCEKAAGMTTAKLQVGFVGLRRGGGLLRVFAKHPRCEVAALCDVNEETLTAVGADFRLADDRLFTKFADFVNAPLAIIVIATPIQFHAPQSIAALESGKHVLCEQTVAYTLKECEQVIQAVERTGKTYMMGENYCYFHFIRQWQDMIARGELGEIFYAEAEYVHEIRSLLKDPATGARKWRYDRAPIWYCAHCLGPLLTLMNDRIVKATGAHTGQHMFPAEGLGYLDMEVGLFQTQKGKVIKILRSQVAPRHPALIYYSLYGTKGCVENGRNQRGWETQGLLYLEETMSTQGAQEIACSLVDPAAPPEATHGGHGTSEFFMLQDFITAIETGTKPPIDVVRAVDFTAPGICAHEAAMRGGVWLDVPLFR
jgi:predicted dehydrogenase